MNKNYIEETDVLFSSKEVFGDHKEHCYNVRCYNGYAIGFSADGSTPQEVVLRYPKLENILTDENSINHVLEYRGLHDLSASDIHYGDIMITYGEILTAK